MLMRYVYIHFRRGVARVIAYAWAIDAIALRILIMRLRLSHTRQLSTASGAFYRFSPHRVTPRATQCQQRCHCTPFPMIYNAGQPNLSKDVFDARNRATRQRATSSDDMSI